MPQFLKHPLQRGQAMVEYAIILIVMTLLVAGGLELATAAYNGYATVEAAKAGATEWSGVLRSARMNGAGKYVLGDGTSDSPGLGDHSDPSLFSRPACNADGSYNNGLPADGNIYLFNPLPLDITDCQGDDDNGTPADTADDISRLRALIYGADGYAGLPKLNQSIYPQYELACLDETIGSEAFIPCADFNPGNPSHRRLMRLPGWLDPSDSSSVSQLIEIDENGNLQASHGPGEPDAQTFLLECRDQDGINQGVCDTMAEPQEVCWSGTAPNAFPLGCNVRVTYRYRNVFESLVTTFAMGNSPDNLPAGVINYFTDRPESAGEEYPTDTPVGILGSEAAITKNTGSEGGLAAKLKPRKDFSGCFETALSDVSKPIVVEKINWDSATQVSITTPGPHFLSTGDPIRIRGAMDSSNNPLNDYNQTFTVSATTSLTLTAAPGIPIAVNPEVAAHGSIIVDHANAVSINVSKCE